MPRYAMTYMYQYRHLDKVIEADFYRTSGKFFEFLVDKEVVRSLKLDTVTQIRRMDDDEEIGDDDEEDDPKRSTDTILTNLLQKDAGDVSALLVNIPEVDLSLIPEVDLDEVLANMPD